MTADHDRPEPSRPEPPSSSPVALQVAVGVRRLRWEKIAPTIVIAAFMSAQLYVGFEDKDIYPFSSFPMYSRARKNTPFKVTRYEMEALTESGDKVTDLATPLGPAIFLRWQRRARKNRKLNRIVAGVLLDHNDRVRSARGDEGTLSEITIYKRRYRIPYPHPEVAIPGKRKKILRVAR